MRKPIAMLLAAVLLLGLTGLAPSVAEKEAFEVTIMMPENAAYPMDASQPIWEWIREATGATIKMEAVPDASYNDKKATLLATNNLPEILRITQSDASDFGRKGAFVDLQPYIDEGAMPNLLAASQGITEFPFAYVDGALYYAPRIATDFMLDGVAYGIRTDLLKKHGLEVPATFDELYDVLAQLKAIYPESYPYTGLGFGDIIGRLAVSFGSVWGLSYDRYLKEYRYGPLTEETRMAIEYMAKMYENGILDPDFAVNSLDTFREKLATSKSFFFSRNKNFTDEYNTLVQAETPDALFEMIPYPANYKGDIVPVSFSLQWGVASGFAIAASSRNADRLVSFLDWFYSEEGFLTTNFGKVGYSCEIVNGIPEFTDLVIKQGSKGESDTFKEVTLGLTLNIMAQYFSQRQWTCNIENFYESVAYERSQIIANSPNLAFPLGVTPPLTEEETERSIELKTKVDTITEQEALRFVIGQRPMEEWDAYVSALINAGAEELVEIYNTALRRALGGQE